MSHSRSLLINGVPTSQWEFTHQVAISDSSDTSFFCGGSMIDAQHVLTAAHCLYYPNANGVYLQRSASNLFVHLHRWQFTATAPEAGSGDDSSCTQSIGVSSLASHPTYAA